MKYALLFIAILAVSGCASVDYSDAGGRAMVDIKNSGWYLFNFIPIASGNPDRPNEFGCKLFKETATVENNAKMLDFAATERKAKSIKSIKSSWTDESVFIILFKRHVIHTSAELTLEDMDTEE
ncbi:MAG: hypothetical protein J6S30_05365 [Kiritimatiellae bacterium]|nr:hypothetical protein [Kiritimatiellia bacterium]